MLIPNKKKTSTKNLKGQDTTLLKKPRRKVNEQSTNKTGSNT